MSLRVTLLRPAGLQIPCRDPIDVLYTQVHSQYTQMAGGREFQTRDTLNRE